MQIDQQILISAIQGLSALGPQPKALKLKQLILTAHGIFISKQYLLLLVKRYQWLYMKMNKSTPHYGDVMEKLQNSGQYYICDKNDCCIFYLIRLGNDIEFTNLQLEEVKFSSCKDSIHPNDPRFDDDDILLNPNSSTLAIISTWHGSYRITHDFFEKACKELRELKSSPWSHIDLSDLGNCLICIISMIRKGDLNPVIFLTQLVQHCYPGHDCLRFHSCALIVKDKTLVKFIYVKKYNKWSTKINLEPSEKNIGTLGIHKRNYTISKHAFSRFIERRNLPFDSSNLQDIFKALVAMYHLLHKSKKIRNLQEKKYRSKYGIKATYRFYNNWILIFDGNILLTCYRIWNIVYTPYTLTKPDQGSIIP